MFENFDWFGFFLTVVYGAGCALSLTSLFLLIWRVTNKK